MSTGSAFHANRRSFRLLMVTALCMTLSSYAARMMGYYRGLELGAGPLELGLLASSFAVFSLLLALPLGRTVDRIGEHPMTLTGVAMIVASTIAITQVRSVWALAISLALLGLGQTTAVVANQSTVVMLDTGRAADARFGHFAAATSVGQLTGPALAGAVAGTSGAGTNIDAALLTAAAVAGAGFLAATMIRVPHRTRHGRTIDQEPSGSTASALTSIRRTPGMARALLVSMAVLSSIDVLAAYLPALGESRGLSVQMVGLLLSVRAAASLVSRMAMASLLSRVGRKRLLMWSVLLPGAALALMPLAPWTWALFALMVCVGFGLGLGQPITLSWVATSMPAPIRGTALSIRMGANRFAQVTFPGVVGLVTGVAGTASAFVCLSIMLITSGMALTRAPIEDSS